MAGTIRDYLVGLTFLAVTMVGYQFSVAKWLQPPSITRTPIAVRSLEDTDESIADLYPVDSWQRGRAIRLKTQDGMLLFQNWEQNKDDRDSGKKWRLWPITMIIGRGLAANGSDEPIVIEADEGAVIEFSAALDPMSGVAPTIQRGQLLGQVDIRRISPTPRSSLKHHGDDQAHQDSDSVYHVQTARSDEATFRISTANVGIDRRKIWTTEAIHMQVGRAVMVGRDLTLHMAASTSSSGTRSNLAGSLDRMELIYLRELTLPLTKPDDPPDTNRGVVEVHCDGRIEYDFALDQLLMDRNVRLIHRNSPEQGLPPGSVSTATESTPPSSSPIEPAVLDRFDCEHLRLTLRDPLNSDRTRETALDWVDRIEATGNPVQLQMKSQAFALSAQQLIFDPVEGWLVAETDSATTMDSRSVELHRGGLHASLARIVYRFDPKHPQQLGTVEVEGSGQVRDEAQESILESFQWRDRLRVSPLDVATTDALDVRFGIWCDGAIQANLIDGGTFQTDRMEGIIKPDPGAATRQRSSSTSKSNIDRRWFPERAAAIGNVRVRSATLHADTPQLNLFFEQDSNASPKAKSESQNEQDASIRNWVSQPTSNETTNSHLGKHASTPLRQPASIRGDQVTAKLTFGERELTATDLSVTGHVEVIHPLQLRGRSTSSTSGSPDPSPPPETMLAILTGDQLRLRDGGGTDVLQLGSQSSTPARLELGDGYFIGPEIQVRPDDNYVWIPAAGEFLIPTAFLPAIGGQGTFGTSTTRWTKSPKCRFGGSMTFDGRVATLSGGVDLFAEIAQGMQPSEIQMRGDELKFMLESKVDLRTPASFRATRLTQVSLLQTSSSPVEIQVDRFAADGIRQSRHDLRVSQLSWVPDGVPHENAENAADPPHATSQNSSGLVGEVIAPGPGSYRGWFRTLAKDTREDSVAGTAPRSSSNLASIYNEGMIEDSRPPSAPAVSDVVTITGVHLIYQDGMRGDLFGKSLTFSKGVRIARKIVEDFNQTFEARDLNQLSLDEMTLDCAQIRLAIDPASSLQSPQFGRAKVGQPFGTRTDVALEIEARGGVVFRSRTDRGLSEATADRCGYAVAKDLVTIEGVPGRPARFQQTDLTGRPVANLAIRTMTLRLKPFELVSSQVESIQTSVLPQKISESR